MTPSFTRFVIKYFYKGCGRLLTLCGFLSLGGSDGPSPRKKNKSASQSTPAPVPEPVKEEVVTTGEKGIFDACINLEIVSS